MLQIAICDDQPMELDAISAYLSEYFAAHTQEAEVKAFSHPDTLLTALETESFHLYILDIVMPMVSGLELGKEIRRLDREAQIIFATTEPQYALQAYASSPINYLIKPVDRDKLFDTLSLAISKINLTEVRTFAVKTTDGLRVVRLSDIVCCEYQNHAVVITLINGEELTSRTFRESFAEYIASVAVDAHFLQCHTSFLINMKFVDCFAKDSFTLRGGKVVPIVSRLYATVRDSYMDYLMAKEVR